MLIAVMLIANSLMTTHKTLEDDEKIKVLSFCENNDIDILIHIISFIRNSTLFLQNQNNNESTIYYCFGIE